MSLCLAARRSSSFPGIMQLDVTVGNNAPQSICINLPGPASSGEGAISALGGQAPVQQALASAAPSFALRMRPQVRENLLHTPASAFRCEASAYCLHCIVASADEVCDDHWAGLCHLLQPARSYVPSTCLTCALQVPTSAGTCLKRALLVLSRRTVLVPACRTHTLTRSTAQPASRTGSCCASPSTLQKMSPPGFLSV